MRIVCTLDGKNPPSTNPDRLNVLLYGRSESKKLATIGAAIPEVVAAQKLGPRERAWDLLSIALGVMAADTGVQRTLSSDGWTRELQISIPVNDAKFWNSQRNLLEQQLRFLTTDIWTIDFEEQVFAPAPTAAKPLKNDSISLLSGGLDSLIGALDLVARHKLNPLVVSQVTPGDKENQAAFAASIGGGLRHIQFNHNVRAPGANERSQRARSFLFLAYGTLAATCLERHIAGEGASLYVCENGLISINPPLTGTRLGALSTRTTHPYFVGLFQDLLTKAGLKVSLTNPYQFKTKGEMMAECGDQAFLRSHAVESTSCGRFARTGFTHCGRCIPCLIRRAAFHRAGIPDQTPYRYKSIGKKDRQHARHDDVRSALMAVQRVEQIGVRRWAGPSLSTALIPSISKYRDTVDRGMKELGAFLHASGLS